MKPIAEIQQIVNSYHEMGETVTAAECLIAEFGIAHPNLKGFELRERAKAEYILLTAEGELGAKQIIRIPDNVFEFSLVLILNLIAHEMIHVEQRSFTDKFPDRNEREWQAYYEMVFHKTYPQVPDASVFHRKFFATKGLEYYKRMGENSALQKKYADQKAEVEQFLASLG